MGTADLADNLITFILADRKSKTSTLASLKPFKESEGEDLKNTQILRHEHAIFTFYLLDGCALQLFNEL